MSNTNPPAKPFTKGNEFYKMAAWTGRPKSFATPDELWQAACTYFEYCTDNPIPIYVSWYGKLITRYKIQAMSLRGLCLHIGLSKNILSAYKKDPVFAEIMERIDAVIYIHNYKYAAVNLLDGRITGSEKYSYT